MAQNYVNTSSHVTSAASSPVTLLARCLVLASVLPTHYCSSHILQSGFCSASTETSPLSSALSASWLHCGRRCSRCSCCCTTWTSTATWWRRPGGRRTGCWRSSPTSAPSGTASSSCLCKHIARAESVMWLGHKSLHLLTPGPGDDQALKTLHLQANISTSPGGRPSSFGCSVIRARRRGRYTSCA